MPDSARGNLMGRMLPLFLLLASLAAAEAPQAVLAKCYENAKKMQSLRASLVMEVKKGDNYSYVKAEYASRGKKIFMKMRPPQELELKSDGRRVFVFVKQINTVYLYNPTNSPREFRDPLEQQQELLRQLSDLTKVGEEYQGWKKVEVYEGQPAGSSQFLSRLKIWLDRENGLIFRIETYDLHGQPVLRLEMQKYRNFGDVWLSTRLVSWSKADAEVVETMTEYKDVQVNVPLPDSFFDFVMPAGVKVEDLTKEVEQRIQER